jgi:hypothetical protein
MSRSSSVSTCLLVLLLALLAIPACDGGEAWYVGMIDGPGEMDEGASAHCSIKAYGDTGITYFWSVNPSTAGYFSYQNTSVTTFTANQVSSDLQAVITVSVDSDNHSPVTDQLGLVIRNTGKKGTVTY